MTIKIMRTDMDGDLCWMLEASLTSTLEKDFRSVDQRDIHHVAAGFVFIANWNEIHRMR